MSLSMLRKSLAIGAIYYAFAIILTGCCNCDHVVNQTIRWTGLELSSSAYSVAADGTVSSEENASMDYSQRQYKLSTSVTYQFIAANFPRHFGLFNEAYACKCPHSALLVEHPITEIKVLTVNDYDRTHPAGSDITNYFGDLKYNMGVADGIGPLQLSYTSYYEGMVPYTDYNFYLVQRPTAGTRQQFQVVATLSDGSVYSSVTSLLQF